MLRCAIAAALGLLATSNPLFAETAPGDSAPATEAPSAVEAMEDPQIGDHWTYELRDEITGEIKSTLTNTVTDVSANDISIKLAQLGTANLGYLTFDRSWNATSNGVWRYTPNDGTGIRAPLAVGKTWPIKTADFNSTSGASLKRSGTSKVTAKETITTRAGTFDTFKIETSYTGQNSRDPTKKWEIEQQTWYAPAIDHWVKRSFVSTVGRTRSRKEYGRACGIRPPLADR